MSCCRFLLLCLLMWTVPLQGIAAVSMQFCGVGTSHSGQVGGATAHHAGHEHLAEIKTADAPSDINKTLSDVAHKCGVCAACCSAAVISSNSFMPVALALPSALLLEPQVLVYAVSPRLPEKPPRA